MPLRSCLFPALRSSVFFPGPRVSFDKVHKSVLINRLRDRNPYVAAAALQDRFKLILRLHSLGDHLYADRFCQSSYAFEKIEMFSERSIPLMKLLSIFMKSIGRSLR